MLLKAALNGRRSRTEHPALPTTPEQLALDAARAVTAGAGAIHLHVRDSAGSESLAAQDVARTLQAVRAAIPGVRVGVSTGAWIVPDRRRRLEQIGQWELRPDFASVNFHEDGATEVARLLIARGVGVEAGIANAAAADLLAASGLAEQCLRVMLEPAERDIAEARANAAAIDTALDRAGVRPARLLHGENTCAWPLLRDAVARGYDTRIGLEDVLFLPNGAAAPDNAALVDAAMRVIAAHA